MSDELPQPKHKAPATPFWVCPQETFFCRHGHPLRWVKEADGIQLYLAVKGHILLVCQTCHPTTFAFGLATLAGDEPLVMCWAITESQYGTLKGIHCDAPTRSILRFIGYSQYGPAEEHA